MMTLKIRLWKNCIIFLIAPIFLNIFLSAISGQSTIYVQGTIPGDTTWNANTVKVTGDVTVNGTLAIEPGTYVEFQGHYRLNVNGMLAIGTPTDSIIFTINDATGFYDFDSTDGGWNGIYLGTQSYSHFEYCKVKYGKVSDELWGSNIISVDKDDTLKIKNTDFIYNYSKNAVIGGTEAFIYIRQSNISDNFCSGIGCHSSYLEIDSCAVINNTRTGITFIKSEAFITNNIISKNNEIGIYSFTPAKSFIEWNYIAHNKCGIFIQGPFLPENGLIYNNKIVDNRPNGGIYLVDHHYPIINNTICNNISFSDGGGLRLIKYRSKLNNNTIINNSAPSGGGIWLSNSRPYIHNCIIRGNNASQEGNQVYFNPDIVGNNTLNISIDYCNIEGSKEAFGGVEFLGKYENNIDNLPYFLDPENGDYSLTDSSFCINAGTPDTTGLNLPAFDLAGNLRIYPGAVQRIDIGAYEFQDEPVNKPPILDKTDNQEIFVSTSKDIVVSYSETDPNDSVSIEISSSVPNINIESVIIDTSLISLKIIPEKRWTGTGHIFIILSDKAGHFVTDTFTVNVTNEVCGEIIGDVIWNADTIKVNCDVNVAGNLTIEPGTYVEFQGHYQLKVNSLQAIGTSADSIIFTINDTTGFHDFNSTAGGWNGIRIIPGRESYFEYCKVKYGKKFGEIQQRSSIINSELSNTLVIKNCDLTYNYSNIGGVVGGAESSINIIKCNISNNFCYGIRGHCSCRLEVDSCVITNNDGVGISCYEGRAYITNNIISNNNGTGISENEGSTYISGNVIAHNKCGINIQGSDFPGSGFIFNNKILYNSPQGGIRMGLNDYPIINNIIAGNSSSSLGGGIYLSLSYAKLINNTIVNNSAQSGGGISFRYLEKDIYNCIIRGNVASQSGNQIYCYSSSTPDDYNFTLNGQISYCNIEGGKEAFGGFEFLGKYENNIDELPYFLDPENGDYSLTDSSPCINAGIPDTTGLNLPEFDFAGNPRIYGGRIDAGAYEFQGIIANGPPRIEKIIDQEILPFNTKFLTVNFYDPDSGDLCTLLGVFSDTPEVKIHDLVDNSSSVNFVIAPDSGWLGNGEIQIQVTDNHGNIGLQKFQVIVSKTVCGLIKENTVWAVDTIKVACDVTIGKGITLKIQPGTIVEFTDSCQLNVLGSIVAIGNKDFRITFTSSDTTGFYNFTHKGWQGIRLNGDGIAEFRYCDFLFARNENNGGALYDYSGKYSLSVTNCNFYNNFSQQHGGAVYLGISSVLEFKNNIFLNNHAYLGGAVFVDYLNLDIVNNLFINNQAYEGAAIYTVSGAPRLINNTFVGNKAERSGGGLTIYNGNIINCIIWGNETGFSGKEVNLKGSVTFSNCIIEGGINGIAYSEYDYSFLSDVYSSDPNFISIPDFDFHLTDSSVAINSGTIDTSGLSLPLFDLDGNPRIYAGINRNIDIGAYEFQNDPINRKPVILFPENLFLNISTSEREVVNYVDPDPGDIHTLNITSNTENLKIINVSGDTSGSYFDLLPVQNWKGRATITIRVEDSHDNVAEHSCEVLVGHLACGNILDNTIWDADTIHVTCDVTVTENALLKIMPGTVVLFHGFHSIEVLGQINATGTESEKIVFTSEDSAGFYSVYNDGYVYEEKIGWNRIYLRNNSIDIRISVFKHCIFKYASNSALYASFYPAIEVINCEFKYNISGAVRAWNARSLIKNCIFTNNNSRFRAGAIWGEMVSIIDSCIFKNNLSVEDAGAIYLSNGDHKVTNSLFESNSVRSGACLKSSYGYSGNTRISKNIFINNTSLHGGTGAAILNSGVLFDNNLVCKNIGNNSPYISAGASGGIYTYGNPTLINNTIVYNKVSNGMGGGLCIEESSVPVVYNAIIYGNKSESVMNQINFYNGNSSTGLSIINSNIQGGKEEITGVGNILMYENNIETDPKFLTDTLQAGTPLVIEPSYLALSDSSHCINSGTPDTTGLNLPEFDLNGNPRIYPGIIQRIDIGAYEFQGEPENRPPILEKTDDQEIFVSTSKNIVVSYSETDPNDSVSVNISSSIPNICIDSVIINTSRISFKIIPEKRWTGTGNNIISLYDKAGHVVSDTFAVNVTNEVCGTISGDMMWDADTIIVNCDVNVKGNLTIKPGTYVEFQGHYQLKVNSLQAIGTLTDSIIFTINDTTGFHDFSSTDGGWNGIFIGLGGSPSSFEYCKIKYGKTFGDIWYNNCNIITADDSKLEIKNSDLSYNYSNIGGGGVIVGAMASIKIKESNISNNFCSGIGSHYSDLEIDSCVITNNDGNGIIYVSSSRASITNNIISNNNGRGISTGEPLRSIISGNYIAYNKCGISIREFDVPENGLISNNIIAHNSPEGGIYMKEHNYPIVNNIICNNISNSDNCGGGITLSLCNPKLINNTILNNSAPTGGGLWIISHGEEILNCIFRGNFASQSGNQFYYYDWFGYGDNPTFNTTISNCNIEGGKEAFGGLEYLGKYESNIDELPYFLDPENGDYSLTDSSPCINAGTPDTTGMNLPEFDFAGNPRISDLTIDMGAYEYYSDDLKIILQPVNETKCLVDSVIFVTNAVGGVTGYQWQKEGIDIHGASNRFLVMDSLLLGNAGNYNCIIEGISETISTDTVKLSILNIDLGNDTTLYPGQTIMLDGGDQAETWLWSDGSTGRYYLVDATGVYWLEATNSIGCVSSDTISVSYQYPFNEELAFVTYDNTTGKNIIVWNKTPDTGTKNYIIYKAYENDYLSLDTISYGEDNNYYIDELTDLPGFSNKYALTTIDMCENESVLDNPHKMLNISGYVDHSKGLTLSIEEYQGTNYDKYYIFRGSDPLSLELADSINHVGFYTSYIDSAYPYNETYYQAGIKLTEKYIININGSEREFRYSLSNLYFKPRNNSAPYDIILSNNRIDENMPEDTEVGIISALDYDLEDHHRFHLVSGPGDSDNNNFQIINDKLITAVSFDFESTTENSIRIRAVDDGPANMFYEKVFKIYINDLIESGTIKHIYDDKVIVLPNPIKQKAIIKFPNEENENFTFYLKDLTGNIIIIYGNITSDSYELDRGDLPPGLYVLELSNKKITYRIRIIFD